MLGGLSQGRVSQLVREGRLVADYDSEGRCRYDRASVEREVRNRAARAAREAGEADEREALQREARDRFKRTREEEREAREARQKWEDELREREVNALEGILSCLRQR